MNDIYDIKNILLGWPININYSLILIIFIIILFIVYKIIIYRTRKNMNKGESIGNNIEIKKEKKDFLLILEDFEKRYLYSSPGVFYSKIIEILREILEEKGNKNISKMTFDEINSLKLDNNLLKLIKSIYFKEFMIKIQDSTEIRLELIFKIKTVASFPGQGERCPEDRER